MQNQPAPVEMKVSGIGFVHLEVVERLPFVLVFHEGDIGRCINKTCEKKGVGDVVLFACCVLVLEFVISTTQILKCMVYLYPDLVNFCRTCT